VAPHPDDDDHPRRVPFRQSFADTALKMAQIAPTFPPLLVGHGLELAHVLRRTLGERPVEATLWEELLSLRRGPGCDGFWAAPLAPRAPPEDLLLERAVEIRALVDAMRNHRYANAGQPLDRILRKGVLRYRREVVGHDIVPVAVRLGAWFSVVAVGDEHPRALRDRIEAALTDDPQPIGSLRSRRISAPLLVGLDPVPFGWAIHLHRLGVQGPWLAWSCSSGPRPMGVLAAHHLVLEGPGFAALRADFRRRVRALRVALGLDGADKEWDATEGFGAFDAAPFTPFGDDGGCGFELDDGLTDEMLAHLLELETEEQELRLPHRHTFAFDPQLPQERPSPGDCPPGLPPALQRLARRRPLHSLPHELRHDQLRHPPAVRYATISRGAFSLPDFCYAYCRAQHDAMAVHHPRYGGQGFTFIVPRVPHDADGQVRPGRRAQPVLCSFHTRRGVPEGPDVFKRRLLDQLSQADEGRDLLSRVLDDALRVALPSVVKSAVVRLFERGFRDGGTFLSGRGLVAHITVPDDLVDPVAEHAGIYEGIFGGSCQARGGVALTAVDRGYRRDLCAVGTGLFRYQAPMDLFWQRFAYFLGAAAM
jgi:hypothetical protein